MKDITYIVIGESGATHQKQNEKSTYHFDTMYEKYYNF